MGDSILKWKRNMLSQKENNIKQNKTKQNKKVRMLTEIKKSGLY